MNLIDKIWNEYQLGKRTRLDPALEIALKEYGTKEITGPDNNPEILKYFHDAGFFEVDDEDVSWCSVFMNWCQIKAGRPGTGSMAARSWMNWGVPVKEPQLGDVAVYWRVTPDGWQGHVNFYIKHNNTQVWGLGGNQSNMVNIAPYDGVKLLGYRRFNG